MDGITVEQFKRHAAKFGPECVLETASSYLTGPELVRLELELAGAASRPLRRRTTTALAEQVRALADRKLVVAAIADALNIGERRVREMLKSRTSENGGRKPFVQAELFAD